MDLRTMAYALVPVGSNVPATVDRDVRGPYIYVRIGDHTIVINIDTERACALEPIGAAALAEKLDRP